MVGFREHRPHFIEGMKFPLAADAVMTPPEPCNLQVGDLVTFQNVYGVRFFNRTVTGFSSTVEGGRYVYYDNEAWWFPTDPARMTKQDRVMPELEDGFGIEAAAAATAPEAAD